MRNTIIRDSLLGLFVFSAFAAHSQNVGINTTGASPAASAILDLNTGNSGNKGFLAPQASLISTTDVATIAAPATGLIVYNTNAGMAGGNGVGYYYWNGTIWATIVGAAGDWLLTGNSGTVVGTDYLGTNDANALEFKVDGQKSGWIDYISPFGSFFGFESGNVNTGVDNTGVGYKSLKATTTGTDNTAVGYLALFSNITGTFNTAVGSGALLDATGSNGTALGYDALYFNTGSNNTAVGYYALLSTTSGINNTAMGLEASYTSSGGANQISAFGAYSLWRNLAGSNTAMGYEAGITNTAGSLNTFLGVVADENAGTYNNVTAVGANAYVGASNTMVLGAIFGLNSGSADVNVGIGTNVPSQKLDVNNGNILISNSNIGSDNDAGTAYQLQLQGTSSGLSTFQAGAQGATNYNYTLPTTAPAAGDVLSVSAYAAPNVTLQWTSEPNSLIAVKIITANTAATLFDAGTTWVLFKVIGGGGAGGGVNYVTGVGCITAPLAVSDLAGAGGGAGGYSEGYVTGLTGGVSTYAVTIGAGGTGTAACDIPAAGDGGTTTLTLAAPAYTASCNGGQVGQSLEVKQSVGAFSNAIGGLGGTTGANPGALNIQGATGGYATITQNGTDAAESGPGANSYFQGGASGFEERDVQAVTGINANAYGSGGGGACYAGCTGGSAAGGNGSPGIVLLYEYR